MKVAVFGPNPANDERLILGLVAALGISKLTLELGYQEFTVTG